LPNALIDRPGPLSFHCVWSNISYRAVKVSLTQLDIERLRKDVDKD
jgi:hypothetical protein